MVVLDDGWRRDWISHGNGNKNMPKSEWEEYTWQWEREWLLFSCVPKFPSVDSMRMNSVNSLLFLNSNMWHFVVCWRQYDTGSTNVASRSRTSLVCVCVCVCGRRVDESAVRGALYRLPGGPAQHPVQRGGGVPAAEQAGMARHAAHRRPHQRPGSRAPHRPAPLPQV